MRAFAPQSIATLDDLAFRVAAEGVDSDRAAVSTMVRRAARLGADHILTDLVIDPREPAVARQRAFGELLAYLVRDHHRPTDTDDTTRHDAAWPAHAA
jgi:hypothetical protein